MAKQGLKDSPEVVDYFHQRYQRIVADANRTMMYCETNENTPSTVLRCAELCCAVLRCAALCCAVPVAFELHRWCTGTDTIATTCVMIPYAAHVVSAMTLYIAGDGFFWKYGADASRSSWSNFTRLKNSTAATIRGITSGHDAEEWNATLARGIPAVSTVCLSVY